MYETIAVDTADIIEVADGPMPWTGECNRCAMCCTTTVAGKRFLCEHLLVLDAIGKPGASECAVHDKRTTRMPIRMRAEDGSRSFMAECCMEYPRTKDAVPPECSMVWIGDIEIKPAWSIHYRPTP